MNHYSYNQFHLGDNLIHLHFLRHLALKYPRHTFVHAVKESALPLLADCVEDVRNVSLIRLEDMQLHPEAHWINSWKNAGCEMGPDRPFRPGFWDTHPRRNDFSGFYLELFGILSRQMGLETTLSQCSPVARASRPCGRLSTDECAKSYGIRRSSVSRTAETAVPRASIEAQQLESPFREPADLWFDYPKIRDGQNCVRILRDVKANRSGPSAFDFLVINSVPLSGQLRAFRNDSEHLTPLIEELATNYRVITTHPVPHRAGSSPILCTQDYGLSLTDIGTLSLHCRYLLMVSTGPSWPTFNVWNRSSIKLRVILLDVEQLNLGGNTIQTNSRQGARAILVEHGLLPADEVRDETRSDETFASLSRGSV